MEYVVCLSWMDVHFGLCDAKSDKLIFIDLLILAIIAIYDIHKNKSMNVS